MRYFPGACVLMSLIVFATFPIQADESQKFIQGSFEAILKSHKDKPLIVNFWSVTCPPCLVEMPLWKNLRLNSPEVNLVLVSTDKPEDVDRIEHVLNRYGLADATSWIFADPFKERLRYEIDKKWRGELPRTYFISRNGEKKAYSGMVEETVLQTWVKQEVGS
ncbi:MAG: TlpA family protein disulfide reductase [Rhodospirillales bacterium]|jgi:thiol-disulfide isomerase/thioredoxin|nr:TlpA family protein disulfide reductase [Rhodospirillales bacterium]